MKGSFHIATLRGIPVKIHWTFGFLLLYVAYDTSRTSFNPWILLISIGIVLSVFFCVILHEFGHAFAAAYFGVRTHDIVMTPIGGIARLERMPEGKGQEFWVAIAGPLVNFVIVILIWLGFILFEGNRMNLFSADVWQLRNQTPSYFMILMLANGYLGVFNLLPAFPMDGGRMLRSLLSLSLPREKATRIASIAGQLVAFGMVLYGSMKGQPTMALIGVFIFFAARQENRVVQKQHRIQQSIAGDVMEPITHVFFTNQPVYIAQQQAAALDANTFIVWSRPGIPAGFITRKSLMALDPDINKGLTVDSIIIPVPFAIPVNTSLTQLAGIMQQQKIPIVLINDETGYAGTVTWERLHQYYG